MITFKTAWN